ncbi:MAG: hypothetical protein V3U97_02680 [bacterium]
MKYTRWNFDAYDEGILVCRDNHEKGQPCESEDLSPYEVLEILDDMRAELLRMKMLLESVTATEFAGIQCKDIAGGGNWFDARDDIINQ